MPPRAVNRWLVTVAVMIPTLIEILDTSIPDLGATSDLTVYQIVAVPQTRTLWLKAPEVQDWTEIPLSEALAPSGER